jgi:hypothetical protein
MRTGRWLLVVLLALTATQVGAEAIDKESVDEIWTLLQGEALVYCVVATVLWRWLLVPSFFFGMCGDAGYSWTEWFYVGPTLRAEAGEGYGHHINAAVVVLLLLHIAAWFLSSWSSVAGIRWPAASRLSSRGQQDTFLYTALLALVTGSFAALSASRWIWLSPPILVAIALLSWTGVVYVRSRTRGGTERLTTGSSGGADGDRWSTRDRCGAAAQPDR